MLVSHCDNKMHFQAVGKLCHNFTASLTKCGFSVKAKRNIATKLRSYRSERLVGKELSEYFSDAVNLDFNSCGVSGFVLEIGAYKPKPPELNLCVECAGKVVSKIEELRKISRMKENKENEAD